MHQIVYGCLATKQKCKMIALCITSPRNLQANGIQSNSWEGRTLYYRRWLRRKTG